MKTQTLKVKDLILWDENARFPDKYYNTDERVLINFFISNAEYKIKKLVEAVVKDFELPQLEKLVVWNDEDNNIVLEGNRRLTAYKLLIDPELSDNPTFKDFLIGQKSKITVDESFAVECIVTTDKAVGFRYIDRKHANGNNEVGWQEPERVNYNTRRGDETINNSLKVGLTNAVRALDIPEALKDKILGKGFVTNFFRTLTSTPAKKKYGYKILEKGDLEVQNPNFSDELKVVIFSILNKTDLQGNRIDSRTLNKKEKIEDFIRSIDPKDSEKVEKKIKVNTTSDLFGNEIIEVGSKPITNPRQEAETAKALHIRSKTVPKGLYHSGDLPFRLNSSSLRILYDELRNISVQDFPNATHDLLRSFLECSLLFYFKETGEFKEIKKLENHNPKLGEMLTHIINGKSPSINDSNLIETLKIVKSDYDQPYSLERMNMINHNENCSSSERDVRKAYAQLESLFKIVLNPPK
ncbi:hypothetical protein RT717_14955 [Imperialibacter roseus]|uniref:DUF262 domain-containing protein n=1 Tax=Imperialibacter roseus TaxID=1324217 RepID=A0ABZ0IIP3_9BACT|nr:hypothetical protein [Imperialibacter roseus]WOK04377.1 hypothetical protein RT717_14955 [Imperialibacter roseus]